MTLSPKRSPGAKVEALFDAFAKRVEDGGFRSSCPAGTVCLDLDSEVEALRGAVAASLASYVSVIARHFRFRDPSRVQPFARLLVTAIEGALHLRTCQPLECALSRSRDVACRVRPA